MRLTARHEQVIELIEKGRTTRQIARELDIGYTTVRIYVSQIYHLLDIDPGQCDGRMAIADWWRRKQA